MKLFQCLTLHWFFSLDACLSQWRNVWSAFKKIWASSSYCFLKITLKFLLRRWHVERHHKSNRSSHFFTRTQKLDTFGHVFHDHRIRGQNCTKIASYSVFQNVLEKYSSKIMCPWFLTSSRWRLSGATSFSLWIPWCKTTVVSAIITQWSRWCPARLQSHIRYDDKLFRRTWFRKSSIWTSPPLDAAATGSRRRTWSCKKTSHRANAPSQREAVQ